MDMELLGWIVMLAIAVVGVVLFRHDWGWRSKEEDDPYRYCPRDEE